ncbi:MAG: leucine-rich repeat domain-containing protein, partial [bacterium]|nr:leucine-rich repeat domain-containing protein [bacterium]
MPVPKHISVLQGLSQLTTLYLDHNQLADISTLKGLSNLTSLDLDGNKIRELPEWIVDRGMEIDVE